MFALAKIPSLGQAKTSSLLEVASPLSKQREGVCFFSFKSNEMHKNLWKGQEVFAAGHECSSQHGKNHLHSVVIGSYS